jgi:phthalate 4,5-cis-dihydrodiol dehydrogenase
MDPQESPRRAFADAFQAPAYESYEQFCRDENVEAIYIASPHRFHARQTIEALEHGKHVLVEKPLGLTVADCDAVIAASKKTGYKVIVGHSHAFDPNVRAMRKVIESGDLGRPIMILSFNYTDYLYRPHAEDEFKSGSGGGIVFNQVTHQIEVARLLAGAPISSVRSRVNAFDATRPIEGSCMAFVEFENGVTATLVYSGYDFFDSDEFHHWITEGGTGKEARHGAMRQAFKNRNSEAESHRDLAFGGRDLPTEQPYLPHFGVSLVTCERGDLRLSPNGLTVYGIDGRKDIDVARGEGRPGQGDALDMLWQAVRQDAPSFYDAAWGRATVEALVALEMSSRETREVFLSELRPPATKSAAFAATLRP